MIKLSKKDVDEIDKINTSEKIINIFYKDVYPQFKSDATPNSILLIWKSSKDFLNRLNGDINIKPFVKESNLEEIKNLYPKSKGPSVIETTPGSIAIASVIFTGNPTGNRITFDTMSLTILKI